jgi:hypothetical protein
MPGIERLDDPETADPGDYLRSIEGGETALHVTLKDDKEWWMAHNPDHEPPGVMNGPWRLWTTYPSGPWELQYFRRSMLYHAVSELYYVDYDGEEAHSVHDITAVEIADAPEFVRAEFEEVLRS